MYATAWSIISPTIGWQRTEKNHSLSGQREKVMGFPEKKEIERAKKKMKSVEPVQLLPSDASKVIRLNVVSMTSSGFGATT